MRKWAVAWDAWIGGGRTGGAEHNQEGGVNSFLVLSQKSMWTSRFMWTTREDLMGYEKMRKSVLSQEQEMQTCEFFWGRTT